MNENFVKLNKNIVYWEWYKNGNTMRLFIHCLVKANWIGGNYKGMFIPRGSFPTTFQILTEQTGMTLQEIRTAIKHLKSTGELTVKTMPTYSIFTVNNYELYQDSNTQINRRATDEQQTSNSQLTDEQQSINSQSTTVKEYKNNKEDKEIKKERNKEDNIYSAECHRIIEYLNNRCGTHYRYCDSTNKHIRARLREKYTEEDFYTVIDKKADEWIGTDMEKFLRPETLFTTKFEGYLNQMNTKQQNINLFDEWRNA